MNAETRLDHADWEILSELQRNARLSYTELGRRVGLTAPAVAERIRRMEEAQVIERYRVDVNLAKVGYPLQAIVRIAPPNSCDDTFSTIARRLPEVMECYKTTGEDCFVVRVAVTSSEHLEKLLAQLAREGKTTTSLVLSAPVTHRVVVAEDAEVSTPPRVIRALG